MSTTPLPSSFDNDSDFFEESRFQKFSRRLKEEPLIPFGMALTCLALFGATRSIRHGDQNKTNRMFRARIYAQGFTLVAMVAGSMYWQTDREKRKEFDGVIAERKAKEKNALWIKELEARDEEDKEIRAARDARRKAAAAGKAEVIIVDKREAKNSTPESEAGNEQVKTEDKKRFFDVAKGFFGVGK